MQFLAKPKFLLKFSLFLLLAGLMSALLRQSVPVSLAGPLGPGTEVCGTLSSNTTWTALGSPYLMTCNVTVDTNVTLTIEPGTTIKVGDETSNPHISLNVNGTLNASGTESQPILFTSLEAAPNKGDWEQIRFSANSTNSILNYVTVEYAGYFAPSIEIASSSVVIQNGTIRNGGNAGIQINDASPTITNTTISNNDEDAIFITEASFPVMSGLSASNNGADAIVIDGSSLSSDYIWGNTGISRYHLIDDVTVEQGGTLTIEPGTTIKMGGIFSSPEVSLNVNGTLNASGTETQPILFTSLRTAPDKGDWEQIYFSANSTNSILDYVTVEYAGYIAPSIEIASSSVVIQNSTIRKGDSEGIKINDASPTITNTTISNNNGGAIFISGTSFPVMSGLSASDNAADAIVIAGSSLSSDYIWGNTGISEYHLTDDLTVEQGVTLTIDPGTTIKIGGIFFPEVSLNVNGTLNASGTEAEPILFTSIQTQPDKGDWNKIYFSANSTNSILDYVTVEYAGYIAPGIEIASSSVVVQNSIIRKGSDDGIRVDGASPTIRNNQITDHDGDGLNNVGSTTVDARCNWWGHASGPGGEGPGSGEEVSGDVLYDPWLTVPPPPGCDSPVTPTATPATSTPTATATPATSTPTGTPATNTPTPTPPSGFGVTAITPNEGTTTETTDVTITGNGFVAGSSVQLRDVNSSHNLLNISLADATQLLATVPAKLPPGLYDLLVINPDGQSAVLANAFTVLATEPSIVEVRPNRGVAYLPNEITLYGFSFAIGATVKLDDTELSTTRINGTQLRAIVPADLDVGGYTVTVSNPGGQQAALANGYTVFDDDSNNDLFGYSYDLWLNPSVPRAGEQAQIGFFVHRQGGRNALANVKVRFFRDSEKGTLLGDGIIPFLDPPNDEDSTVPLEVTFLEAGTFDIVAVIDPDNEIAEDTLGEMNNVIYRTVTIGEPAADQTVPVVNDILINNGASQTTNPNVSVDIRASDPNPNPSGMQAVNIIEYEYNIGASQWVPVQQSNWLPYETTPDNYPWQLMPSAGMRYLQVRALDNAANISIGHARKLISYEPESDMVARRQTRVYRYEVAEGEQLEAVIEVISGDPDLYVWSENPAESARVSNQASGNEQVIVPADEIVPGVYQIEVYGYSEAEYRLQVTVGPATTEAITQRLPLSSGPKLLPSEPIVPVSSVPDERQGTTPPPTTSSPSEYTLYLPAITR